MAADTVGVFDKVLESIGSSGTFQKRFNWWFNFAFVLLASMPYMNIVFALAVPEHWCHVPGREETNYSLEEWKSLTIPSSNESNGLVKYSKCKMFNRTVEDVIMDRNDSILESVCLYGWEYDKTWYEETAPTAENWVCDTELYATNSFVICKFGEMIGTLLFGQLGDSFGRKPIFLVSVISVTIGRCLMAFTSHIFWLFSIAGVIGSLASASVFQAPLVISMEISREDDRAHIAALQCLSWSVGLSLLPLVMWYVRHWVWFLLLTTFPSFLYLLTYGRLIESPRWLAGRGKLDEAVKVLRKIAKVNGTVLHQEDVALLKKAAHTEEKVYGVMSLFSSWRLAKNTFLLLLCMVASAVAYSTLVLNVTNQGGNPFLNFMWQSFAEFPSYLVGKKISNSWGRRWTQAPGFILGGLFCLFIMFTIRDPSLSWATSICVGFVKFFTCIAFFAINLQSLETYPTCLRQTGIALGIVFSNLCAMVGPYIVFLGTVFDPRYPYILIGLFCVAAGIGGLFLPETLHKQLPETLAEAQEFGAGQKFWSLPRKIVVDENELRQNGKSSENQC